MSLRRRVGYWVLERLCRVRLVRRYLTWQILKERQRLESLRAALIDSGQVVDCEAPIDTVALWNRLVPAWTHQADQQRAAVWDAYSSELMATARDPQARRAVHERYQAQLRALANPAGARLVQARQEAAEAARRAVAASWARTTAAWQKERMAPAGAHESGGRVLPPDAARTWFGLGELDKPQPRAEP